MHEVERESIQAITHLLVGVVEPIEPRQNVSALVGKLKNIAVPASSLGGQSNL